MPFRGIFVALRAYLVLNSISLKKKIENKTLNYNQTYKLFDNVIVLNLHCFIAWMQI